LEELIGSHGGLGGEQTDAFVLHPPEMNVPPTRNSIDVFHILNARRGLSVDQAVQPADAGPAGLAEEWSSFNLTTGLKDVRVWLERALRCLILDASAYRSVANDQRMMAPGLLLGVVFVSLMGISRAVPGETLASIIYSLVGWFIAVIAAFIAGKLLTKKGYFSRTLRTMGFANVTYVLYLFAWLPQIGALIPLVEPVFRFVATWIAVAEAHETSGWRTLILPVVALAASAIVVLLLNLLFGSAVLGIDALIQQLRVGQ
jgi:hypothetical protein